MKIHANKLNKKFKGLDDPDSVFPVIKLFKKDEMKNRRKFILNEGASRTGFHLDKNSSLVTTSLR